MIDVRDEEFNLIKRVNVPDCLVIPCGRYPFAFTDDGHFYYHGSSYINGQSIVNLYKYDTALNVIWSKKPTFPVSKTHYPISMILTEDNGIVLQCTEYHNRLRLYKISPQGDLVSAFTFPNDAADPVYVFGPNPFTTELYCPDLGARRILAEMYDLSGRLCFSQTIQNGVLRPEALPEGLYVLRIRNADSGETLHVQKVVKRY